MDDDIVIANFPYQNVNYLDKFQYHDSIVIRAPVSDS